jgi:hypothetical protein
MPRSFLVCLAYTVSSGDEARLKFKRRAHKTPLPIDLALEFQSTLAALS